MLLILDISHFFLKSIKGHKMHKLMTMMALLAVILTAYYVVKCIDAANNLVKQSYVIHS